MNVTLTCYIHIKELLFYFKCMFPACIGSPGTTLTDGELPCVCSNLNLQKQQVLLTTELSLCSYVMWALF